MEFLSRPCFVQEIEGFDATLFLSVAEHVESDSATEMFLGSYSVHGLLHLAVTTVSSFHGIRGGREQFVIKERQRLVQVGRLKFAQNLADGLEATDSLPKLRQ